MGVLCKIFIQKPRNGIHRAGQTIIGKLSYTIDQATEYKSATLSLIGKAKCHWSQGRQQYYGKEVLLSKNQSILDQGPEGMVLFPVGTYEFRFQFVLPNDIPSSFEDKHSSIKYHVTAKFKKASLCSFTKRFKKEITVYGNVNPSPVEVTYYALQKNFFNWSSMGPAIDLKVQIAKTFLHPGENIALDLHVTNDSNTDLTCIIIKLSCKTTYTADDCCVSTKVVDKVIPESVYTSPPILRFKANHFTCVLRIPQTLYTIRNCKIINKEFYIRVTMCLPFPHMNAKTKIPIVIGEGRYEECSENLDLEDAETGLESVSESPPSCMDVMKTFGLCGCVMAATICFFIR